MAAHSDIFRNTKAWCLQHDDPEKRQFIQIVLEDAEAVQQRRERLAEVRGLSRKEVNDEIIAEITSHVPVENWKANIADSEDPRIIAVEAIMTARLHMTELIPSFEECVERVESVPMREAIALALGCLSEPEGRPFLERLSQDEDLTVSNAASWALQLLPSKQESESTLMAEFRGFLDGLTASDFVRYEHYHPGEE